MIKQIETTCYNELCDYKADTDYDYFIFKYYNFNGDCFYC